MLTAIKNTLGSGRVEGWVGGWMDGWMDGWVDGWESLVKDCLQQSKIENVDYVRRKL